MIIDNKFIIPSTLFPNFASMKTAIPFLLFLIMSFFGEECYGQKERDTSKPKYNPHVDSTYYFPTDSNKIISDTSILNFSIKTRIFPIEGKYIIEYHEYVDDRPKEKRDKILYRDYNLEFNITNNLESYIRKVITKDDIPDTILNHERYENYYIRDVKFRGFDINNKEFRFDIKICNAKDTDPLRMIKYFIISNDKFRIEDYPKSYYDSLYPIPDFIRGK